MQADFTGAHIEHLDLLVEGGRYGFSAFVVPLVYTYVYLDVLRDHFVRLGDALLDSHFVRHYKGFLQVCFGLHVRDAARHTGHFGFVDLLQTHIAVDHVGLCHEFDHDGFPESDDWVAFNREVVKVYIRSAGLYFLGIRFDLFMRILLFEHVCVDLYAGLEFDALEETSEVLTEGVDLLTKHVHGFYILSLHMHFELLVVLND